MGLMDLFTKVPSVDAASARDLVRDGAVLLDVRESSEWNAGHAPQAAHLPLGRIADASKKVRDGKQVVVVCRSGNRSRQATKALISMGYDGSPVYRDAMNSASMASRGPWSVATVRVTASHRWIARPQSARSAAMSSAV